jgi:hypothetical protein
VRTGLGARLDRAIDSAAPSVLKPAGFRRIKRQRAWERTAEDAWQLVAIVADGRTARDGYMTVGVSVGLTYAWEQDPTGGWMLAGRHLVHGPSVMPGRAREPEWSFRADTTTWFTNQLAEHLQTVVVPALDRWRSPRSLRNHYLATGHLEAAIRLSAAIGDRDLARALVPAYVDFWVRHIATTPTQSPAAPGRVLELAAELDVRLAPGDEAFLRADLRAITEVWRRRHARLPGWAEELAQRFL